MKRLITLLLIAAWLLVPSLAAAQAPAQTPEKAQATAPAKAPEHPAATPAPPAAAPAPGPEHPKPGTGMACPMGQTQMTPEQMKQMQDKCCAMMQEGKGCPMHQKMQKQMDELTKRVEALEKQVKGKKK